MKRLARIGFAAVCITLLGGFAGPSSPKGTAQQVKQAIPAMRAVLADDPNIKQFEDHYGPAVRQLYKAELHFMRTICKPNKAEFDKIAAAGEPATKAVIRSFAMQSLGRQDASTSANPQAAMVSEISKSIQATLSKEQAALYLKEVSLRNEAQKEAVLQSLVVKIDGVLILSPEQRVKLAKTLESNWSASMGQVQFVTVGYPYFPAMPENEITAILTEAQKTVWRGLQKGNIHFGPNINVAQGMDIFGDEVWEVAVPLVPLQKPAAMPAAKAVEKK